MSRLPSLELRTVALMEAIDRHAPSEMPKTEEQVMSLIRSLVRPIVRKVLNGPKEPKRQKGARRHEG